MARAQPGHALGVAICRQLDDLLARLNSEEGGEEE